MAETVQFVLESMIPELRDLQKQKIFDKKQVKAIIKRRTFFEYALKRRVSRKADYLRYLEFEMNLETLRKRIKKEKSITTTRSLSDFAGKRRIHFIFERALIKFKGDVRLWLQYIAFAKKHNSKTAMGKIFGRAIQAHPLNDSLWIMAASWEYIENSNITAARILLQRGLRINNESERAWLEYFRLELLYWEKVKKLRLVMSQDEVEQESKQQQQQQQQQESMVDVPVLTEEKDKKEVKNGFLSGDLLKIVYEQAIKEIPNSIAFRTKFIDMTRKFNETQEIRDFIYESIRNDFGGSPESLMEVVKRPWMDMDFMTFNFSELETKLNEINSRFEELKDDVNVSLAEHYTNFITEVSKQVKEEQKMENFVRDFLKKVYQKCVEGNLMSENMFISYLELLSKDKSTQIQALKETSEKSVKSFPRSPKLWQIRATIEIYHGGKVEEVGNIYQTSLSKVSSEKSIDLWLSYLDWLITHQSMNPSQKEKDQIKRKFEEATLNTKNDERIVEKYLNYVLFAEGVEGFRTCCERMLKYTGQSKSFFVKCINMETLVQNCDINRLRRLYESAVDRFPLENTFWIDYIKTEMKHKNLEKVSNIYWRAVKEVEDAQTFVSEYNSLKTK